MTRKKVKLAFITNDSARKATYKKRKCGLLKKMDELTTLCDVKACAILYSPYETKPVVWPGPSGARDVITSFKRLPEMEKVKKMVSQEEFLRQRVVKAHEKLKRQQKDNREKTMTEVMYECLNGKSIQGMTMLDYSDLGWVINQNLSEINKRIEKLKKENPPPNNNININQNNNSSINNMNFSNNIVNNHFVLGLLPVSQAVGPRFGVGGIEDMHMQMMMQPWPSYMDMMGPSMMLDHQQHLQQLPHQELGNNGFNGGLNGNASSSTSNNNMNMIMMNQFSDYQGVNPALRANNAFLP